MGKKRLKGNGIFFSGKASEDVTGSQYLVRYGDYKCLLECGLHQSSSNDYLDSYRINFERFQFRPSDIDYVFVAHTHIDHCGLLPRLVKEGFHGRIIATRETAMLMKPLLLNCAFIVNDEARILSHRYKREYEPLYSEADVYNTLALIDRYEEYDHIYELNDTISFQWLKNSHCIGAAQLQLILNNKGKTRKILYTSDLGAMRTRNHYLENTERPTMFNDLVIMESTYGSGNKSERKTRKFDIEHLEAAVRTVTERGGSVIMPCFSFSRTQELLTTLYDIFGNDNSFNIPVVVDSKLSCDISKLYSELLSGDDLTYWEKVSNWKNVKFISEKEDSRVSVVDRSPKIVLSSSGFCTNGRVVEYLRRYIRDNKSMIIFSGYVGDNPTYLSYRIKNFRGHKMISINKEMVPNLADCITMSTFSSHANYTDLLKFGSSLNTNKLVLVHGSEESKTKLSAALREEISKNDRSYKVVPAFRGMVIDL